MPSLCHHHAIIMPSSCHHHAIIIRSNTSELQRHICLCKNGDALVSAWLPLKTIKWAPKTTHPLPSLEANLGRRPKPCPTLMAAQEFDEPHLIWRKCSFIQMKLARTNAYSTASALLTQACRLFGSAVLAQLMLQAWP